MSKYVIIYNDMYSLNHQKYNSKVDAAKSCKGYYYPTSSRTAYMIKLSHKLEEILDKKKGRSVFYYLKWLINNLPHIDYNEVVKAEKRKQVQRENDLMLLKKKEKEESEKERKIISVFFDFDI